MAVISNYSEEYFKQIDTFLKEKGLNCNARAGLIGNLYVESHLFPNNLQNCYEGKAPYYWTDDSYTKAVDNGSYSKFNTDRHGYGLCQWTSLGRKQGYYNKAKEMKKSVGDMSVALEWLWTELTTKYKKSVLDILTVGESVDKCARVVMLKFESPANQTETAQLKRVGYAQAFYDKYYKNQSGTISNTGSINNLKGKLGTETENGITYFTYTVAKGDSLSKIAKNLNTTVENITKIDAKCKANPNLVNIGQVIRYAIKETAENNTPTVNSATTKIDAAKSYSKSLSKEFTTTAKLNMRASAGTSGTKITVLPKGTKVRCYGYYTSKLSIKWLLVSVIINNIKYTGFCCKTYLK